MKASTSETGFGRRRQNGRAATSAHRQDCVRPPSLAGGATGTPPVRVPNNGAGGPHGFEMLPAPEAGAAPVCSRSTEASVRRPASHPRPTAHTFRTVTHLRLTPAVSPLSVGEGPTQSHPPEEN